MGKKLSEKQLERSVLLDTGALPCLASFFRLMYGDQARFFEDEIRQHLKHKSKGMVAMASASRSTCAASAQSTPHAAILFCTSC